MCGILGLALASRVELGAVRVDSLRNRGPDNVGSRADGNVGFLHTRLAVIDKLETSNQPLVDSTGELMLVCNGEIYNFRELRTEFKDRYEFLTNSDCETILAAYRLHGLDGFKWLRGMFSFGLYDRAAQLLIVHRDPIGKKPLFVHDGPSGFGFSSSVTALKENLAGPFPLDKTALDAYMREGFIPPDRSLYQGIRPVRPGECLLHDVRTRTTTTKRITPPTLEPFEGDESALLAEAERVLTTAVARRVAGIEHPVLLFSGGIDSTLIAQLLSRVALRRVSVIGMKPFLPLTYDEPYGLYAARKLGVRYHRCGFDWKAVRPHLEHAVTLLDQPLAVPAYFFLSYLTLKAREFGNVLYSGDGGDEVFFGYKAPKSWFASPDEKPRSGEEILVGPPSSDPLSDWGLRQAGADLLGHGFVRLDKATAEQQMEARCPFLGWDVLAFARSIPRGLMTSRSSSKWILKELLRPSFPGWFVDRPKIGTAYNFRYLLLPQLRELSAQLDVERLADLGYPDARSFHPATALRPFHRFDEFLRFWVLDRVLSRLEKGPGPLAAA